MGLKVIGIDITAPALEEAKACGADAVFDSARDKDWKDKVVELTGGGVDAAVNFTASKKSYDDCPPIIKPGQGVLMVVGIPREPLQLNALDIALGRYRVKGSNNGSKWVGDGGGECRALIRDSMLQHEAGHRIQRKAWHQAASITVQAG